MSKCYFELRKTSKQGSLNLAADMMRHLHTRQYLGKTVVICQRPNIFLPAAHKQWLRLSRTIQRQRANTVNADKILKYTRTITHMQHMRFVARAPLERPDADVFFIRHNDLPTLPLQCFNLYCTADIPAEAIPGLIARLPAEALIVDYGHSAWHTSGILPKRELEAQVLSEWQKAQDFLHAHQIDYDSLFHKTTLSTNFMDDALDTLLGVSNQFLEVAHHFNRALELARPLRLSKTAREQYDIFTLLAHRVQALSADSFTQRFLETYNEDDTFFLYDVMKYFRHTTLDLAEIIAGHRAAGRLHLAQALINQAFAS